MKRRRDESNILLRKGEEHDVLLSYQHHHHRRPFPSSSVLTTSMASQRASLQSSTTVPLIQQFYAQLGIQHQDNDNPETQDESTNLVDALDDCRNSTLTLGQHQRYKKLLAHFETGEARQIVDENQHHRMRKEFHRLRQKVQQEQAAYQRAMAEYCERNSHRYLWGFRIAHPVATPLVKVAFEVDRCAIENVRKSVSTTKYGPCSQVISLNVESIPTKAASESELSWWLQPNLFEMVSRGSMAGPNEPQIRTPLPTSVDIPPTPSSFGTFDTPIPLEKDDTGLELARTLGASIFTTADCVESLLVALNNNNNNTDALAYSVDTSLEGLRILEGPFPRGFASPRTCVTRGLWACLMRQLQSDATHKPRAISYRYTIMHELPGSKVRGKVLIRSAIELFDNNGIPWILDCHWNYFPERGLEVSRAQDHCRWILHSLLHENNCTIQIAHVGMDEDNKVCRVLEWQSTSLAHALAEVDTPDELDRLWSPWKRMAELLLASSILPDRCLLQRAPSANNNNSFSVHLPAQEEKVEINLADQWASLPSVRLDGPCAPAGWRWNPEDDRVVHTFPLKLSK